VTVSNYLTITIAAQSAPQLTITGKNGCYKVIPYVGEEIQLNVDFSGGLAPYNWVWVWPDGYKQTGSLSSGTSGVASTSRIFPPGSTVYSSATVTINDNSGQSVNATATVTAQCG
jgi:hypothetical protein